jgi:hypothetical protein
MADTYPGELTGSLSAQPESNGSLALYDDLALSALGQCNIEFHCVSTPALFDFTFLSETLHIFPPGYVAPVIEVSKRVTLRFEGSFAQLAEGKETAVANAV